MKSKNTLYYRSNKEININFDSQTISSDGSLLLLEKIEKETKLLHYFSKFIPDTRTPHLIKHSIEKQLTQRVYAMMQGYEDANDVTHLKNDPLFKDVLGGELASQSTISRLENSMRLLDIIKFSYGWVDKYIESLAGRNSIIIDVDGTDDPAHGAQQGVLFNGYYGQFMYNELFFHDGETGQIILPILRPGNAHSNKWFVPILRRIVKRIKKSYPQMKITIRADGGFSNAAFYKLAEKEELYYAIGLPSNNILKRRVKRVEKAVKYLFQSNGIKHQHFISYEYKANSWHKIQQCYAKIESTGIGMNTRHIVSNLPEKTAREIYFGFYVLRGDASENRIKEVKNMCYSGRLSNHNFIANYFRLFLSSIVYEMFVIIKSKIKKTSFEKAKKWQIDTIRTYLFKVAVAVKHTKKRIYYSFTKAFVFKELFRELIFT
jgi:hypothetical protein